MVSQVIPYKCLVMSNHSKERTEKRRQRMVRRSMSNVERQKILGGGPPES